MTHVYMHARLQSVQRHPMLAELSNVRLASLYRKNVEASALDVITSSVIICLLKRQPVVQLHCGVFDGAIHGEFATTITQAPFHHLPIPCHVPYLPARYASIRSKFVPYTWHYNIPYIIHHAVIAVYQPSQRIEKGLVLGAATLPGWNHR